MMNTQARHASSHLFMTFLDFAFASKSKARRRLPVFPRVYRRTLLSAFFFTF